MVDHTSVTWFVWQGETLKDLTRSAAQLLESIALMCTGD